MTGAADISHRFRTLPLRRFLSRSLFYGYFFLVYGIRRMFSRAECYFYPGLPEWQYAIWKCMKLLGIRPSTEISKHTILAYVHDDQDSMIDLANCQVPASDLLNVRCEHIGKEQVTRTFESVFGRALGVDPLKHVGPMVVKSVVNAAHDGRVVEGPLAEPEVRPDRVYQRLIDNECGDGLIMDLRASVVGDEIPFVWRKYRSVERRFINVNDKLELSSASAEFTSEEQQKIFAFARAMGLDIGELDILRSQSEGQIYIVDVSKTPHGPPTLGLRYDGVLAMRAMARAFRRQFLLPALRGGARRGAGTGR